MEELRAELQRRTAPLSAWELLRRMGYRKPGEAALRRLNEVLEDPDLGLSSGGFDFCFGSREFLCALCDVVGLDEADYLPLIEARQQWLSEEQQAFKPYLFIDTGFRRSDRPGTAIFVLAACEGMRRLTFPEDFWRKPLAEQVQLAQARVREFMAETGGDVKVWGTAQRFLFFYAQDAAIEIAPSGKVLGDWQGGVPNQASWRIGNQAITTQLPASDTDDR
ncbi:hypothetical protein [Modicisalibacter luteus]|uniref:Uncharacterized protein n=1 Tax=Modicisalibacter luteus TaxID=453962 RepID=A0ABV7M5B3_9GAMM|nr:hypothetical protein [Halomonas lutea]GHB07945.1 hypothetical protein GCM10007159_32480 [Halomonas lutea]